LTDKPADISDQTPDEPEGWSEGDDLSVARVRELFTVFAKALRAFQLYDENNPVRRRFVTILDTGELAVVSKTHSEIEHIHQSSVRVISDAKARPLETPVTVDIALGERMIMRTTDAQKYGIRVSDYLI
jgi:hypothetical protein